MKLVKDELAQACLITLLADTLPELVWIKDTGGRYLSCNKKFEMTFNVQQADIEGLTDSDFLTESQATQLNASDDSILNADLDDVDEVLSLRSGHDKKLTLDCKKYPLISTTTGKKLGILGLARNVTDLQESALELEPREHLFRTIFNMQFQFTAILALNGEVIEINDLPLKVQGATREDYIGKKFWDSPAWRDLPEWKDILQRRLLEARTQHAPILTEDVFQTKDGSIRYARASTSAMRDAQDNVIGFIIQATDITELKNSKLAVQKSEIKYRALYQQIPQGVVLHNANGIIIGANPAAETILGRPLSVLVKEYADPSCWQAIREDGSEYQTDDHPVMQALRDGKPYTGAIIGDWFAETESYRWIRLDAIPLFHLNDTKPHGVFTSFSDISEHKQTEEKLRLAASVFENTKEGIIVTDSDGTIVEINQSFTDITGYTRAEAIGHNPRLLKSQHHDRQFYHNLWASLQDNGSWSGEIWNKRKDGTIYPVWQNISTVTDHNDKLTHYVAVFADIELLKESQQELDHLAYHDALTDLPNRLLLKERLDQAILHAERHHNHFTVIFLDLDNFKNINDSLGHPQGDKLLQTVAKYLLNTVRQGDTVARIGGDEFVLLLEELAEIKQVEIIANKILLALQQPITLDTRSLNISASLGICLYPQDGKTTDELLRNADAAMYRAKDEGRNNYQFYSKELTDNAFMRVRLENDLRQALSHNELRLHFQPQIDLANNQLVGVEALVRWQHPTLGMIMPSQFIAIAETSGLILPMGNWVLEQACFQAMEWLDTGIDIGRVAVNVSGLQLQRGDLVEQVKKALKKSHLPASKLELEVTEGFIMQHVDSSISQLQSLRDFGVALAIDDFGTGYSSLSYLKQLPIHKLKIDQSFIHDIPINADDRAISRTIVALGDSLGMRVIAEGVENDAQAQYLKGEGCHEVQGYLYSKPVPIRQFEQYYHAHKLC